ncbi:MAG: hypothetical protein LLF92_01115 [Planctomycetaceae bacterium]|nr:hypothetical protein [Planctomycetaceae bacterium]
MKKTQINTVVFRHGLTQINTVVLLSILLSCCCLAEESPFHKPVPASDGFMLNGIDGKITTQNGKWYFSVYEPTTDGKGFITSPAEILPSSMLEKLVSVISEQNNSFRVWGKLTTYKDKNYVYLSYFLKVTKVRDTNTPVNEPDVNESKIIPDDALALLKPTRVINLTELQKPMAIEADGILTDRTGFLKVSPEGCYFGFDAMGRNVDLLQLPLLQCKELEQMEKQQKASAFPLRFKIFAIVTKYKGKNYLLLQRAARLYSHGNFAR